ncbi:MAG: toll/interleukin-1 receptor domain-containing protein [Candidatus Bathyarchaeota archaeon]|nr:toll/interleukin-1 receptor domain-containing protein [Candidatus Bathyarchaeota archaeon]
MPTGHRLTQPNPFSYIITYPKFTSEDIVLIHDSIDYIKTISRPSMKKIDNELGLNGNYLEELDKVMVDILSKKRKDISMSDYFYMCDLISSSLKLYLIKLNEERNIHHSDKIEEQIELIYDLFNEWGFRSSLKDLFNGKFIPPIIKTNKKVIFLSYSIKDKKIADTIYHILMDNYYYDIFLAHETIGLYSNWREEILNNLDNCQGLIAIVTNNYLLSPWSNQEVGYILGQSKPIVSLFYTSVEKSGVLEMLQGIPISKSTDLNKVCKEIHDFFENYRL